MTDETDMTGMAGMKRRSRAPGEAPGEERLAVLFGGRSDEHEISLLSAASVIRALEKSPYRLVTIGITRQGAWRIFEGAPEQIENGEWEEDSRAFDIGSLRQTADVVLPVLHGPCGEDGTLQGLLEMLDIPYCGCGVLASALAMDKIASKQIFRQADLPVCPYVWLTAERLAHHPERELVRIEETLGYPVFVKPANMGSSVGISKAGNRQELEEALKLARKYDRRLLVEAAIPCREYEAGVIGNWENRVSVIGEILPSQEFYDYRAKYLDEGRSRLCIPADISPARSEELRRLASRAYEAIDGAGFARVDFFEDRETGRLYINEVNTIPGFTPFSMFPRLWEAAGLAYPELLERIVNLGYERYYTQNHR